MRRLASFRKHVEGLELEKQAQLLTCPKAAKEEIGKLLNQLQQQVHYHHLMMSMMMVMTMRKISMMMMMTIDLSKSC